MNIYGIDVNIKNVPSLDKTFTPIVAFNKAYLAGAKKPFAVAVERANKQVAVYDTFVYGTPEMAAADNYFADRMVKFLLWAKGGFKVTVSGDENIYNYIKDAYSPNGSRAFDFNFMQNVYETPFEVCYTSYEDRPQQNEQSKPMGKHMDGYRIGFDAGGSDRKVSAVVNGESIFSEETVWNPKITADPEYHYEGILDSFRKAAAKMPTVDAIGVSSAGIYINNRTMVASLFLKVPKAEGGAEPEAVKNIYIRAAETLSKEIGKPLPLEVANDGDVSALAGAMGLNDNQVMGIAMGTSEAVGYVDKDGNITGWLSELAFAPVDAQPEAMEDEWSGDIGCGVKYFSQDGIIKLAGYAGIELPDDTPANKLKVVQKMMLEDDPRAIEVYKSTGVYLGHALAYYADFYDIKHVLLLGRVTSGKGGDIVLAETNKVLAEEYPELSINVQMPDEKTRRVGQSAAAASLPAIG